MASLISLGILGKKQSVDNFQIIFSDNLNIVEANTCSSWQIVQIKQINKTLDHRLVL